MVFWQWLVPRYNERSSSLCLTPLEASMPLDQGNISGDLTDYGTLRAVKGTEEGDELCSGWFDHGNTCVDDGSVNEEGKLRHVRAI